MPSTKKPRWWVVYCVSWVTKINVEEQEQHSCGTNKRRRCAGAGSTCKLWLPVNIGQVNITPSHTTDATGLATFKYLRQTFILYVCLWNGLTNLTSLGHYGPSRVNSRQNNIAGSTTSYFIYLFTANILITTLPYLFTRSLWLNSTIEANVRLAVRVVYIQLLPSWDWTLLFDTPITS